MEKVYHFSGSGDGMSVNMYVIADSLENAVDQYESSFDDDDKLYHSPAVFDPTVREAKTIDGFPILEITGDKIVLSRNRDFSLDEDSVHLLPRYEEE